MNASSVTIPALPVLAPRKLTALALLEAQSGHLSPAQVEDVSKPALASLPPLKM